MADQKEKKYQRIGWISSIATQLALLILFYFLIAWKEPFPPIPSYGIELSFGIEETGSGDEPVSNPEPEEVEVEPEPVEEEVIEEVVEPSTPEETVVEEVVEEPVESVPEEVSEEPLTDQPSPDVTETKTEEVKTEAPEVVEKKNPVEERPKVEEKKEPVLNPNASMPSANESTETNESRGTTSDEGNEGKEEGTIDGRALMGDRGSADGATLNLSGWKWVKPPKPKDESSESGFIKYEIEVDADGYIRDYEVMESTVPKNIRILYDQSLEKLEFQKTSSDQSAPISTGTITFIIKAN